MGKAAAGAFNGARRRVGHAGGRVSSLRGFTLVEVVVAFALLGFALTLLLGAMTRATGQVRRAEMAGRAALHAQTLLHEAGVGTPLATGATDGVLEDGRFRWTLQVAEWQDPDVAPGTVVPREPGAPRLLEIELAVAWDAGGPREQLVVHSLRHVRPVDGTRP